MDDDLLPNLLQSVLVQDTQTGHIIIDDSRKIVWHSPAAASLLSSAIAADTSATELFAPYSGVNALITSTLEQGKGSRVSLNVAGRPAIVISRTVNCQQRQYCHLQIEPISLSDNITRRDMDSLKQQYAQMMDMAGYLFASKTTPDNKLNGLTLWQHKTARFSSDVVLTAKRPGGGINIFLGNFVGGIIPAAVGAFPLAEVFYGMTGKGYGISDIIAEMNNKLQQILPDDLFCVAAMVEIDPTAKILSVWNGGLPDILVINEQAKITHRVTSSHIPLGLHKMKKSDLQLRFLETDSGDIAYMLTAGLEHAVNSEQQKLGMDRLTRILIQCVDPLVVQRSVEDHIANAQQNDDMTLLALNVQQLASTDFDTSNNSSLHPVAAATWQAKFEFSAEILRQLDLVPLLINIISHIQAPHAHRQRIYTVLAELCTNAIDHGILQLDSSLKQSPKGFAEYYMLRAERLAALEYGQINVELAHKPYQAGGLLSIMVADNGAGFDVSKLSWDAANATQLSGRGLALVKSLCRDLSFNDKGNQVDVSYYWENT